MKRLLYRWIRTSGTYLYTRMYEMTIFTGIVVRVCLEGWPKVWEILGFQLGLEVVLADGIQPVGNPSRQRCIRCWWLNRLGPRRRRRLERLRSVCRPDQLLSNRLPLVWFRFRFRIYNQRTFLYIYFKTYITL